MCTSLAAELAVQSLGTLTANTKFLDEGQILITALLGDVFQQALALSDKLKQAAAGHEVVFVALHVLSQLSNPGRHNSDLYCRAAAIFVMGLQVFSNFGLLLTRNHSGS